MSNSSWSGTTRWARPTRRASHASIGSPVRFISRAFGSPTIRGSRWVPPKPGMIPRLISGWPKLADSPASRKSQAIASSHPPPKAIELTAAIVTVREPSIAAHEAVGGLHELAAVRLGVHLRELLDVGARPRT